MKRNRYLLALVFIYCLSSNAAKGQLIFSDQITSGAGTPLNTYNGWDNNSSNCAAGGFCNSLNPCVQLVSTPITSPVTNYINSTNSILSSFGAEGPGRCFTPVTLATTPNVYIAFLCTITSCPDNSGGLKGDMMRLIGTSAFNVVGRVNATATAGKVAFRVGADGNAGLGGSADGTTFNIANNTFLLILKYEAIAGGSNDVVKLFVYPTTTPAVILPLVEPTPYASVTFSNVNPEPASVKGFHIGTFLSQTTSGMPLCNLGAFKVTTSWTSLRNVGVAVDETPKSLNNLTVFPQPVADNATIDFTSTVANAALINVLDASGRVVWSKNAQITEGSNNLSVPTLSFAKGLYLVQVNNGLTTVTAKFIKE